MRKTGPSVYTRPMYRSPSQQRTTYTGGLNRESDDKGLVRRLADALQRESWGRTILGLAWTAGPVTYFALFGGYYISYGTAPPTNLILYFAVYTVIAGVFAVVMRIGYHVVRGGEKEEAERLLTETLGDIPTVLMTARDQLLEGYDPSNRRLLAAKHVIENSDALPNAVARAVYDLTESRQLADAVEGIDVYRRGGLYSRVEDLRLEVLPELEGALEDLRKRAPALADLLHDRFHGRVTNKAAGRMRTEGFLERILSAGENDNFTFLGLSDVDEIMVLLFELLAGRELPYFSPHYSGGQIFRDSSLNLDKARREYRSAVFARNSRLRMLVELLNESEEIHRVAAAIPVLQSVQEMSSNIVRAIETLYEDMARRSEMLHRKDTGTKAREHLRDQLAQELRHFRQTMQLYRSLYEANHQVDRAYTALFAAEKKYSNTRRRHGKEFALRLLGSEDKRDGIRIIERTIALDLRERQSVARVLSPVFRRWNRSMSAAERIPDEDRRREAQHALTKQLAVESALALDKKLHVSRPAVQFAIESTNAAALGAIESGLTRSYRIGWAMSLVRELAPPGREAVHRIARYLTVHHHLPLTAEARAVLVEEFDADPAELDRIAFETSTEAAHELTVGREQLLLLAPPSRRYLSLMERLNRVLGVRASLRLSSLRPAYYKYEDAGVQQSAAASTDAS